MSDDQDNPGRERTWLVRLPDWGEVSTADLTLDEVELVERVSDVPWTLLNPHASVKVAKALLVVLLRHGGMGDDEALARVGRMKLRELHGAFEYVPSKALQLVADEGRTADPPSSAPTSASG